MSGLDLMKQRLEYRGGACQQDRMFRDKLDSLKASMKYSYQGANVEMPNPVYDPTATEGIESMEFLMFRALMNPDKLKPEYDDKILSIPFEDICLNLPRVGKRTEGYIPTNAKPGVVFRWVDTDTWWIIYLQYLEERAYFRGDCYACEDNIADVNGKRYHVYFRGPDQFTIDWHTKNQVYWNNLNYTKIMYITKDDNTLDFFHRFKIIYVNGDPWEVVAKNENYADGIILVHLKEYYHNTAKDAGEAEKAAQEEIIPETNIIGNAEVYPYEVITYSAPFVDGVPWEIINESNGMKTTLSNARVENGLAVCEVEIKSGRSGSFTIKYGDQELDVKVLSF